MVGRRSWWVDRGICGTQASLAMRPIHTFAEASRRIDAAGSMALAPDGGRLRDSVRKGAADRAGLVLSSQVLDLSLDATKD
jgi:hypothetical protein